MNFFFFFTRAIPRGARAPKNTGILSEYTGIFMHMSLGCYNISRDCEFDHPMNNDADCPADDEIP